MTAALTRLWWRLEDVLPLAEHAMACSTQARTAAQPRTLAPGGPALTWTSNGDLDLLTSNGMPSWHHPDGTAQHAVASAWQYRTVGYGTVWRDTYKPVVSDSIRPTSPYPLGAYRWPWQTTEQARVGRRAVAATHRWWQRLVQADRAGR